MTNQYLSIIKKKTNLNHNTTTNGSINENETPTTTTTTPLVTKNIETDKSISTDLKDTEKGEK